MFITIDVWWAPDNADEMEDLGQEIKYVIAPLELNTDHISAFHKNDNGELMVRIDNGDVFRSPVNYESFKSLVYEIESEKNSILISGEN